MGLFAPLLLALLATVVVAVIGNRLRPRHSAWLSAAALGSVFGAVLVTSWAVALGFLAHEPATGELFGWCRDAFGVHHPLPRWVGVAALVTALLATARAGRVVRMWRRGRGSNAGLVRVVEADRPVAFAETGRAGGIVVSTAMLAALSAEECRAMLAHEHAHLRHRHDRFLVVGSLAAGVGVLAPAVKQLRHALERWADEDAAGALGDRCVVAAAVARAALVAHDGPVPVMSMLGANVPARVEALMRPPISNGEAWSWAAFAGVVVAAAVASVTVQLHHLGVVFAAICPG